MLFKQLIVLFAAVASTLGAAVVQLDARQYCSALQLVHISGTTEIGLGIVGTPLAITLALVVPGTTTYSVPYNTSAEYKVTVAEGAAITANYLTSQAALCPSQKFVLSGYSKGALVVHATTLSSAVKDKVATILVFGDPARNNSTRPWPINSPSVDLTPRDGSTSAQNIASFCNSGDKYCDPNGTSLIPHIAYAFDGSIGVAAKFVKSKV